LSQGYDYESPTIISLLEKGWAVVISDYEGLGTLGDHTYMIGASQGRVALDVIRAAQRLPQTGLSSNAPVILMGYSQGGAASSWASELACTYAPEINIIAAVSGGVPTDLEANGRFVDGTAFAGFALIASFGLNAAYDEINLTEILNEDDLELLKKSSEMCIIGTEEMDAKLGTPFTHFTDYAMFNPVDDPTWQYYMAKSKLGKVAPKFPVYLYYGVTDMIVPYEPAAELRRDWCRLGAIVEWHPSFEVHLTELYSGPHRAINWIENRIDGIPVYGNCSNSLSLISYW
jgi:predicted esterase